MLELAQLSLANVNKAQLRLVSNQLTLNIINLMVETNWVKQQPYAFLNSFPPESGKWHL